MLFKGQLCACVCVCVHSHNGILLGHKKENSAVYDSMDGLKGHFAKLNKLEKEKYYMFSHTCGIVKETLKKKKSPQIQRTYWWLPEVREGRGRGQQRQCQWEEGVWVKVAKGTNLHL